MDLAPKLFRGYKANGEYDDQTIKNIVLDESDSAAAFQSALARYMGSSQAPTPNIGQQFINSATDLQSKSKKKRKKTKEVKNG